jgi:hypothetical protein
MWLLNLALPPTLNLSVGIKCKVKVPLLRRKACEEMGKSCYDAVGDWGIPNLDIGLVSKVKSEVK